MSKKTQAKARVQITVEVDAAAWGEDCTVAQIYIGEPKIIAILTEST